MNDRRPSGWNHWAEVVYRDPLNPRFIGDAPHGWVGSDFLRSVRTLFAYEKPASIVVASGLSLSWLQSGLRIKGLATEFGKLSLGIDCQGTTLTYKIDGSITVPVELMVPFSAAEPDRRRCIVVPQLPATIVVELE